MVKTCTENIREYEKFQHLPNWKKLDWCNKANVQHKELENF